MIGKLSALERSSNIHSLQTAGSLGLVVHRRAHGFSRARGRGDVALVLNDHKLAASPRKPTSLGPSNPGTEQADGAIEGIASVSCTTAGAMLPSPLR